MSHRPNEVRISFAKSSRSRRYRHVKLISAAIIFGLALVALQGALAKAGDKRVTEALHILQRSKFRIINTVAELPRQPFVAARLISPGQSLNSFIVDKNYDFQQGDAWVDLNRPRAQIIFGGISKRYVFVCFWMGGDVLSRRLLLIDRRKAAGAAIFYCTLDHEVQNLADLQRLLNHGQISVLEQNFGND